MNSKFVRITTAVWSYSEALLCLSKSLSIPACCQHYIFLPFKCATFLTSTHHFLYFTKSPSTLFSDPLPTISSYMLYFSYLPLFVYYSLVCASQLCIFLLTVIFPLKYYPLLWTLFHTPDINNLDWWVQSYSVVSLFANQYWSM